MADILATKIRQPGGTKHITVHVNSSRIDITYSTWSYNEEIKYKLLFDDEFFYPSTNATLKVYKDDVYIGTTTITCTSGSSFDWTGTGSYDGISISVNATAWQSYSDFYEEFTLYREDDLAVGSHIFGASSPIYKIIVIDGTGSHTAYHEQIVTPTFVSADDTESDELTWVYKNEDPDVAVDMYARLGTDSFVLKANAVAAGSNGTIIFTGLDADTSYNVDVYCVQDGTAVKQNSAEATNTQTTDTAGVKTWVYQGTSGTYNYATTMSPVSLCKLASTTATKNHLESVKPAVSQTLGYKARVNAYDTATPLPNWCGYDFFEVELV